MRAPTTIRTTIRLPRRLKQLATARARARKTSFNEFVRQAVERAVIPTSGTQSRDPLFSDLAVYDGPVPSDISVNHDKYLYDDPET